MTMQDLFLLNFSLPFNIASYSILVHMIAQFNHTKAFELTIQLGNSHTYNYHHEPIMTQIDCQARPFPKIKLGSNIHYMDGFFL